MKTTITQNLIFRTFSRLQRSCCSAVFLLLFLLSASSSWGQTYKSFSPVTNVNSNQISINKPQNLAVGDLMIAQITRTSNNNATMTNASSNGWSVVSGNQYRTSGIDRWHVTILQKFATEIDVSSSTESFTFTGDETDNISGAIMAFSNACVVSVVGSWGALANDNSYSAPSIYTTTLNSMVVMFGAVADDNDAASNWIFGGSSMTEIYDFGSTSGVDRRMASAVLSLDQVTSGSGSADLSNSDNNTSILLAISGNPTVTASANASTICSGGSSNLTSTASFNNPSSIINSIGFESSETWSYTNSNGSTKTGTSGTGDLPASTSFVNSGSNSFWRNNGTATVTTDNITGLSAYTNKYFQFDLAAFSIGSTGNGVDDSDLVTVAVSVDGGSTYSNEITVAGNSNAYWGFATGTGLAEVTYDGNNTATAFAPGGGGNRTTDGYGLVKVNLPNSATQVRVRITLLNNSSGEAWVIDDLTVAGTAITGTYSWSPTATLSASNISNPVASPTSTTEYTVTATNSFGCTATASTTVNVNSVTAGSIGSAQTICSGGDPAAFTSTAGTGSGTITYRWESNTNLSTPSWSTIANQTAATYNVPSGLTTTTQYRRITISTLNSVACESAATTAVQVTVNPIITPTFTQVSAICSGASLNALPTTSNNSITGTWSPALNNTATTTYTFTPTAGQCAASASMTITVNTTPAPTANAQTICSGLEIDDLVATGTDLKWYAAASGGSALSTETELSESITYYVSQTIGSCESTRIAVAVTVLISPNAPEGTNGSSTISGCPGAGVPVTVTANGNGVNVFWYAAPQGGTKLQPTASNTFSPTITQNTIYYAQTESANGCVSLTRTAVEAKLFSQTSWIGGATGRTDDWFTASNWSCGAVPNENTNVVIPSGSLVSVDFNPSQEQAKANSVVLQGTASLTVTSDHSINVTNKVTVASGATFTVQNNASLVQTDNVTNEGNITVVRNTSELDLNDCVIWSSPVTSNQQLGQFASNSSNFFFNYNSTIGNTGSSWVAAPSTQTFAKGKGCYMKSPNDHTPNNPWIGTFTGVANNGDIDVTFGVTSENITSNGSERYYLVGNPYPSAIDIQDFFTANQQYIEKIVYLFRKPNGNPSSSYNTVSLNPQTQNIEFANYNNFGQDPGSVIPAGQGFFVKMKTDATVFKVMFNNGMRRANNHRFFNRSALSSSDDYKLVLTSGTSKYCLTKIGYYENTNNEVDPSYDVRSMGSGTFDLSSLINAKNYSIQARAAYNQSDVVYLRFRTNSAGEHKISLSDASGVFAADQMVIIKDNLTGVQHNLTANGDYVFTATAGTFTNRFEVVYQQAYYTALQANSCGATIANMNSLVYADIVNGATGYRFKVVNNTTSAVQTIDRPQHWFAFNMLSAYDYNTPYTISVQVQKDGVWTGYYGATCTVNSPNISATGVMQINPSQCGATLATLGTVIATTPVAGATGYKFRITNTTAGATGSNMVQEITRSNHWFTLGMLSRYNYGSSYTVEVAVKTTGAFTPYGNACTVYSPSAPTLASCGQTVATATTLVRTTAMTLATQYRFQVTRMSTQETITFDTANFWFSFRVNVPGYAAGEQYGVRVAVMTAGAWSPFGDACDITAPIASARTNEEASPSEANLFKPVAYPNPFASTFGISLATPSADVVHVMVYDLQGRLIEKQNVFVSQLDSLQIGTNYPSGDYLLVVAQGANIKSSHIHKD